jgi:DNA recombination protein RmuC
MVVLIAVALVGSLLLVAWSLHRERSLAAELAAVRAGTRNDEQVLDAAELVAQRVLAEQAERLDRRLVALERTRVEDSSTLRQVVLDLRDVTLASREETARLSGALRDTKVRGLWGETQLRRVVELAGMTAHCDFVEQRGVSGDERAGRPDLVVRLPNGRNVVIDAKAPLDRYLQAVNCEDAEARRALLAEHAKAVRAHVVALSRRGYAELVDGSVDVVVLFLPGDSFLGAALDGDPTLLEAAWSLDIVLATPGSTFALLRTISAGWQERRVADEAAEIARLGRELRARIGVFVDHHARVGRQLARAVEAYNSSVGSLETRLLSTARKLDEHAGVPLGDLPTVDQLAIEGRPRSPVTELPTG